jgi:hypothetical protein
MDVIRTRYGRPVNLEIVAARAAWFARNRLTKGGSQGAYGHGTIAMRGIIDEHTYPPEKQGARIAIVERHIRLENQHDLVHAPGSQRSSLCPPFHQTPHKYSESLHDGCDRAR